MAYKFPFEVPTGEPVHFLRGGSEEHVIPALLTAINEEGVADLVEVPRFGGNMFPRMGVRFIDDPWHKENPEQSRETGVWRFRPAMKEIETEEAEPQKKKIPEPASRK